MHRQENVIADKEILKVLVSFEVNVIRVAKECLKQVNKLYKLKLQQKHEGKLLKTDIISRKTNALNIK